VCQELFTSLLEGNGFAGARRERGRFRNYLMGAAMHRLLNERRDSSRRRETSLDDRAGTGGVAQRGSVENRTAEDTFFHDWARRVVSLSLEDVASEYDARGLGSYFVRLRGHLAPNGGEPPYAELAAQFEKRVGAVKMDVFRLRKRFTEAFRSRVLQYTPDEEADDEMRGVLSTLVAGTPA
jgi:RNA polymerase sigma-70 factor (ECF subfamily)